MYTTDQGQQQKSLTWVWIVVVVILLCFCCVLIAAGVGLYEYLQRTQSLPFQIMPSPAAFEGKTLAAPDCDYGGFFKSIEATDQYTVTFTLCKPDAAFLSKIAFSPFAIYPEE